MPGAVNAQQWPQKPVRLVVPFAAVTAFADPSVRFGLQFDVESGEPAAAEEADAPRPAPTPVETASREGGPREPGSRESGPREVGPREAGPAKDVVWREDRAPAEPAGVGQTLGPGAAGAHDADHHPSPRHLGASAGAVMILHEATVPSFPALVTTRIPRSAAHCAARERRTWPSWLSRGQSARRGFWGSEAEFDVSAVVAPRGRSPR